MAGRALRACELVLKLAAALRIVFRSICCNAHPAEESISCSRARMHLSTLLVLASTTCLRAGRPEASTEPPSRPVVG